MKIQQSPIAWTNTCTKMPCKPLNLLKHGLLLTIKVCNLYFLIYLYWNKESRSSWKAKTCSTNPLHCEEETSSSREESKLSFKKLNYTGLNNWTSFHIINFNQILHWRRHWSFRTLVETLSPHFSLENHWKARRETHLLLFQTRRCRNFQRRLFLR